eukprot:TRINITY_DN6462_c0_g1_i1.p1 TRINITY_DN6462_c0_g1~~TRINITY_DN6462_c0_g1_i1.p1  ORF type:complete len:761 (-),score=96.57 TRINITY_DN6462_c0_g1_i1:667-2949(-)
MATTLTSTPTPWLTEQQALWRPVLESACLFVTAALLFCRAALIFFASVIVRFTLFERPCCLSFVHATATTVKTENKDIPSNSRSDVSPAPSPITVQQRVTSRESLLSVLGSDLESTRSCECRVQESLSLGPRLNDIDSLLRLVSQHFLSWSGSSSRNINENDDDDVVVLRTALESERIASERLQKELDQEQEASQSAAIASMAMMSKLQKEKSESLLEANQKCRMAEEKAAHDEEVIQFMTVLMARQHEELQRCERELQFLRSSFANSAAAFAIPRNVSISDSPSESYGIRMSASLSSLGKFHHGSLTPALPLGSPFSRLPLTFPKNLLQEFRATSGEDVGGNPRQIFRTVSLQEEVQTPESKGVLGERRLLLPTIMSLSDSEQSQSPLSTKGSHDLSPVRSLSVPSQVFQNHKPASMLALDQTQGSAIGNRAGEVDIKSSSRVEEEEGEGGSRWIDVENREGTGDGEAELGRKDQVELETAQGMGGGGSSKSRLADGKSLEGGREDAFRIAQRDSSERRHQSPLLAGGKPGGLARRMQRTGAKGAKKGQGGAEAPIIGRGVPRDAQLIQAVESREGASSNHKAAFKTLNTDSSPITNPTSTNQANAFDHEMAKETSPQFLPEIFPQGRDVSQRQMAIEALSLEESSLLPSVSITDRVVKSKKGSMTPSGSKRTIVATGGVGIQEIVTKFEMEAREKLHQAALSEVVAGKGDASNGSASKQTSSVLRRTQTAHPRRFSSSPSTTAATTDSSSRPRQVAGN